MRAGRLFRIRQPGGEKGSRRCVRQLPRGCVLASVLPAVAGAGEHLLHHEGPDHRVARPVQREAGLFRHLTLSGQRICQLIFVAGILAFRAAYAEASGGVMRVASRRVVGVDGRLHRLTGPFLTGGQHAGHGGRPRR